MTKTKYETDTFKWKFNAWRRGYFSFWEAFFGGHISIGPVTIFGVNAMNWVVNIRTKKYGVVCFTLPVWARVMFGWSKYRYLRWHFYCSPNGTPWASTYYIGHDSAKEQIKAIQRKQLFGHNWDTNDKDLYAMNLVINNYSEWHWVFQHYTPEQVTQKWDAFYNLKFENGLQIREG